MDIGRAPTSVTQGIRASNRSTVIAAAPDCGVTPAAAADMFYRQVDIIREQWQTAAEAAELTKHDANPTAADQTVMRRTEALSV
jgi:nitrate/TMAO reductase-like tetraheme cytochrome c subunit